MGSKQVKKGPSVSNGARGVRMGGLSQSASERSKVRLLRLLQAAKERAEKAEAKLAWLFREYDFPGLDGSEEIEL